MSKFPLLSPLASAVLFAVSSPALATASSDPDPARELDHVEVNGQRIAPSPRR